MEARNSALVYCSPHTVALHLHPYAGKLVMGRVSLALRPGVGKKTPSTYKLQSLTPLSRPSWIFSVTPRATPGRTTE